MLPAGAVTSRTFVGTAALGAALLTLPATGTAQNGLVFNGRAAETAVAPPRVENEAIVVDGVLDEKVWAGAARLTGFSQYRPVDGVAADDSTTVLVWYGDDAIYFGILAYERHGAPVATLADRDRIDGDDNIRILLDTFDDRRRALMFAVNPRGVQADGIWDESVPAGSSLGGGRQERRLDLNPDFLFESRGSVTADGWQAEIRIPLGSLRYRRDDVQNWGVQVVRTVQHSGHEQTWAPARQAHSSFLAQAGRLEGLTGLRRGLVLDVNPVVTARADGAPDGLGTWRYDAARPEPGVNVRWGVTENLTLNAAVNPDFSQVESDAGQLSYDPRQTLFFAEKRPFFLEASENFAAPGNLIYTRRIVDPIAAAKFTGKLSGTEVGVLFAVDDELQSFTRNANPVTSILRVRRDIGAGSSAGVTYTDRIEGDFYNRVIGADTRIVLGSAWSIAAQAATSLTRDADGTSPARPAFSFNASRQTRTFTISSSITGTHPDFVAGSGFISRTGIVNASIRPSYTLYGEPGATVESWTGGINLNGTWTWDRFVDGQIPDDPKLHLNSNFTFRGGWRFGSSFLLESFLYPEALYANYFIDTGTDTIPYTGTHRITNYDFVFTLATPQFRTFRGNAQLILGRDENFQEWAPGYVWFTTIGADWRPTERVRTTLNFVEQRFYRPSDMSIVSMRRLPRAKVEYQLSRPIFFRIVGEYQSNEQDDLRDNTRTELPILIRRPDGRFVRAAAFARASFRFDALFSYQPSPGTVLFVGYGNGMSSSDGVGFGDLARQRDGFFVKLSYLWRM